jgi:hypothetical protein
MRKPGSGFMQNALSRIALAQHYIDCARGGHDAEQTHAQRAARSSSRSSRWIGHGDVQLSIFAPQRHELIAHHQIEREFRFSNA